VLDTGNIVKIVRPTMFTGELPWRMFALRRVPFQLLVLLLSLSLLSLFVVVVKKVKKEHILVALPLQVNEAGCIQVCFCDRYLRPSECWPRACAALFPSVARDNNSKAEC